MAYRSTQNDLKWHFMLISLKKSSKQLKKSWKITCFTKGTQTGTLHIWQVGIFSQTGTKFKTSVALKSIKIARTFTSCIYRDTFTFFMTSSVLSASSEAVDCLHFAVEVWIDRNRMWLKLEPQKCSSLSSTTVLK